uniref:TLDc domain-containing protein n=1 Tax=Trichobilharzia regenti TaxID=157069 RepID=A0AA85KEI3_TRIRE|nr:unnamed protein product [Trichobilharzia regenti]
MGGTNSQLQANANHTPTKTYKGFEYSNNKLLISKDTFQAKFNPCFHDLSNLLWNYFKHDHNDNFLHIDQYQSIIDCLSSSQDKLTIFIKLFKSDTLNESDIKILFKWFTLGKSLQSETWQMIVNSILPPNQDGLYKCDELITSLKRKCQDICNDLITILLQYLNDNHSFDLSDFNPYKQCSGILTTDLLWLFSTCLTYPYKRIPNSCLLHTKPLECEQLSHLHCLYNSTSHGMSLTRILELTFDYTGPIIVLLKAKEFLFCLLSDQGLKESLKPFGGGNSFLYQIQPKFTRLVSGNLGTDSGIIYANFTTKTSKRGLLVGHQPLTTLSLKYLKISMKSNIILVYQCG